MNEQELKEAIELVKKSHPYATKYKGVAEDEALQTLVALAQQYLDIKRMPNDFEYFLTEKHAEQYIGTKDCMVDDFEKWIQELEIDDFIKYGNEALHLCKLAKMKQSQEGLVEDIDIEKICEEVHKAMCQYHKERTGEDYWTKGDYSLLKDEGKEYDRRTVRAVIQAIIDRINK